MAVGNPTDAFWFWPAAEHIYTFIKDIAEAVVLVMILWATAQVGYSPRLLTHSLGGFLVLGLIGTLMITDFFVMVPGLPLRLIQTRPFLAPT